jgi:diaminohydroxyphosphoribosylaminopyrimidine deaminase/5-amino-6-(5-phosphoribosylamino)uracil reductase
MRRAIRLARRAGDRTWPNPRVGALVLRAGRVIGQGYHHRPGQAHAEVLALDEAGPAARGAELFVTLEPCHVWGRTPPCTERILESGVRRVWVGALDPNPRECGAGLAALRTAGLEVVAGVLEAECQALNAEYNVFIRERRPYVVAKAAVSLDGRLAPPSRDARWVSGKAARVYAHRLRARHQGILVGVGTLLADDPALNVRHVRGRDPTVVVLDTRLRTSPGARVLATPRSAPVWIAAGPDASARRARALERAGAEVLRAPVRRGHLVVEAVLAELFRRGLFSLLVEGGSQVLGALVRARAVDRLELALTGWLLGSDGVPLVELAGPARVAEAPRVEPLSVRRAGQDLLVSGPLVWPEGQAAYCVQDEG